MENSTTISVTASTSLPSLIDDEAFQDLILSPRNTGPGLSDSSTISTFECEEYKRLHEILSNPDQLIHFQSYLMSIHAHENLLFVEALSELRHEKRSKNIESIVQRIWNTFLAPNALLEVNVTKKEEIEESIQLYKWAILSKREALEIFKEAENEVKVLLNEKIAEFDRIYKTFESTTHKHVCTRYQKRVVIIGGGFTGFTVASILDPMPRFYVTLIDAKDSFEYTPGMIKLLVRPEETSSLRVRHDAYVKNGRVIIGYAERIVEDGKEVKVNNEYIPLDYLVIATGSTYKSKLKSFDTSSLYRLPQLSAEHMALKEAQTILIIGGGLVGCELASEIATHHKDKKVTVIDSNSNLVQRSSAKRQDNAYIYLTSLGVHVILNEKIVDFDSLEANSYLGASGTRYTGFDKVFFATGTTPSSDILQGDGDIGFESCVDNWGRVKVKPTLQLDHWKYKYIYCGGDVSNVIEEKTGYAATLAGVCIARNICRMEKKKEPLCQGAKGTLPAPSKPLHGIESLGGIGRQHLSRFKKTFSFLNPSWEALKYFDEKEFLNMVQGEAKSTRVFAPIGRKPKPLDLLSSSRTSSCASSIEFDDTCCCNIGNNIFSASSSPKQTNHNNSNPELTVITNLSGSDIISSTNKMAAVKCSNCDKLSTREERPSSCSTCLSKQSASSMSAQQQQSTSSSSMNDGVFWSEIRYNNKLRPRPRSQKKNVSSSSNDNNNVRQQQQIFNQNNNSRRYHHTASSSSSSSSDSLPPLPASKEEGRKEKPIMPMSKNLFS